MASRRKYPPRFKQREGMDWGTGALGAAGAIGGVVLILIILLLLNAFN